MSAGDNTGVPGPRAAPEHVVLARGGLGRWLAIVFALALPAATSALAPQDQPSPPRYGEAPGVSAAEDEAILRPYASGAGPTAIFRMGRGTDGTGDVFGIVDPVAWRIQFLTVDDWTGPGGKPLAQRVRWVGACRLSPDRRVWRVHVRPDRIVLQLQPNPTIEEISTNRDLRYPKIVLANGPEAIHAIESAGSAPDIDTELVAPRPSCGNAPDTGDLPPFGPADAASTVTGGGHAPFIVTPRLSGGSPFLRAARTIGADATNPLTGGGVLTSVQELESARSVNTGQALRHFMVVARSAQSPGFARSAVVIVRRSERGTLDGVMRIDTGLARVKTGQRFAAITSKGEVLLIGASAKQAFWIRSCHFTDVQRERSLCSLVSAPPGTGSAQGQGAPGGLDDEQAPAPLDTTASREGIWKRARWYASQPYRFDASTLPSECRHAAVGCTVAGHQNAWIVISPLRFAHGSVLRRGVPYAQRPTALGTPGPGRPTADLPLQTGPDSIPTLAVRGGAPGADLIVSDINNDNLPKGNPSGLKLFGIDCSTFLAQLWHTVIESTEHLTTAASDGLVRRKPDLGHVTSGDALVINLSDQGHTIINHVVVFREMRRAGPTDSSQAVLVAESSSSCGGVCTSLYDESFFDGWAIIAPGSVSGSPPSYPRISSKYECWLRLRGTPASIAGGPSNCP